MRTEFIPAPHRARRILKKHQPTAARAKYLKSQFPRRRIKSLKKTSDPLGGAKRIPHSQARFPRPASAPRFRKPPK